MKTSTFSAGLLLAATALLIPLSASAQPFFGYQVLVDADANSATGCSVTPTGGAALAGFEHRLLIDVEVASGSAEVISLDRQDCSGGAFQSPVAVTSPASPPWPVGLDLGAGGADVVETGVLRDAVGATFSPFIRLAFVADDGAGSDVLATVDGSASGEAILLGLPLDPVQIPLFSLWGIVLLLLAVVFLGWLAQRKLGRIGAMSVVLLVAGLAWAMNFMLDGAVTDWSGVAPAGQDPTGDATDGNSGNDLVAGFAAFENGALYFRIDVVDIENQAPDAANDAYSTDEDTALTVGGPGVLANDSDAELDPITAVLDAGPSNAASFMLNADGSFDYTPNADFNGADSFSYFANDGQANSAPATVTITVNAINDAPLAADDVATTNEDTQVDIDVLANDSDVDGSLDPATVTVTGGPTNGATAVNPVTGIITYTKSGDFNGADSFTYEVCDDGTPLPALCSSATVSIDVDPVNDAPTFTASNPPAVDEDVGPQTVSGWVTAFDPGPGEGGQSVLAYIVSNVSTPGLFSAGPVVDVAGNLSYTPAADAFGSSTFDVAVQDDGGTANGGTDTSPAQTFTITVTPVNDTPAVADDSAGTDEDMPVDIDVLANDSDSDGSIDPTTVSVSSAPANGGTSVDMTTGAITYTPNADFNGSDAFTYQVCDDGTPTPVECASATVTITVNAVNDAPVIAFPSGGTSFDNTGPVLLDPAATLSDVDSPDFDTGDLTASLALSADSSMCDVSDALTIENQGMGAGQIGFDGVNVSFEGTTFGTVATPYLCTDSGGGVFDIQPLLITFDPNASQAAVTALLRALQYNTTSTDDQDREASAMVTDGDGGTSNAAVTTITVNLNQAPVITSDGGGATATVNAAENQTAVTTVTATDADVPAQTLTFSITGGTDQGLFSIVASTGVLTFNAAPDFENPADSDTDNIYDVQVTVTDDGVPPLNDVQDIAVTVTDVNEAPTITSDGGGATAMVNAAENQTAVTTVTATDADVPAQTLTFSITGGADQGLFSIGASSGVLTFNTARDFENPSDFGTDNIYDVQVTVTDDGVPTLNDVQDIAVTVTDVNEAPTAVNESFAAQSNVGVAPNAMNGLLTNDTDPDSGDSLVLAPGSVGTFATSAGGSITTLADGSFTYTPQAGDAGVMDTFGYTVQDTGGLSDSATVTFNVDSNTIWFVDLDAGTTGDGTLNNPFDSLADLDNGGPDGNGSTIFHYTSTMGTQTDALSDDFDLQASQFLIGEGAAGPGTINDLRMFTTHPHSLALPSVGAPANHAITSSANGGITLAIGNTLRGLDIGNTTGSGISGTSFGTFTVADVLIGGTGQALDLNTGNIAGAGFNSVSSSSGTRNISLVGIGGTLQLGGGSLSGASGQAVFVDGGTGTISYAGSITNTANRVAEIQNKTGGAVTLSGTLTSNAGGTGIRLANNSGGSAITFSGASKVLNTGTSTAVTLSNNTGATVSFTSGGLDIDTTSGTGFSATGGGIVNVTGPANTVTTSTGTAVLIGGATIGGSGVTLRSVTSIGASANTAIALNNTGAGSFEVSGTGSVGSGGTIDNKTADAITLDNTGGSVTLRDMIIEDIGGTTVVDTEHDAIHGRIVNGGLVLDNVTIRRISDMAVHGAAFPDGDSDTVWNGLTITNSTIQDTNRYHVSGEGDTSDEGAVRIRGLRGTALISDNTFQDGAEHLDLFATAGTLNLTVTGNDFFESYKEFTSGGIASVGKMCVDLTVQGTADATVVIGDLVDTALGNNFRNCRIASVRIGNDSGATGTVTTTTANNTFLVTDHSSGIGGDFDFPMGGVKYSTRGATTAVFDGRISNNTFTDVTNADGGVGNVTLDMDQGVIQVLVDGNTFHAPGNAAWFVRADGTSGFDLLFDNNTYQRDAFPCTTDPSCGGGYFGPGLFNRTQAQNGAVLDVTYRNEDFAQHDTGFDPGNTVEVQALNVGGGGTVCASFTGNSSPHGYALEESAGTLNLARGVSPLGLPATCSGGAPANCVTVLDDNLNTGGGGNPAADPPTVSVFGTIDIVSSACSLPSGGIF